jgi:hypothetical protein
MGEGGMTDTPQSLLRNGDLPGMVRWYEPVLLAQIGVRTVISSTFGQYADHRLIQAASDSAIAQTLAVRYDYSWPDHPDPGRRISLDADGAVWIDYVADVGDGFLATYATAYCLAKPALEIAGAGTLPAGQILIMGGDQAYPAATREAYRDRLQLPFSWAFNVRQGERRLFAIPGNHDWYDGLTTFDSLFCSSRDRLAEQKGTRIGGWQCQQHRSYWAIRLPYNWWIWGADIQFSKYLDESQISYFETVAQQMGAGHKVILCLAEPNWLVAERAYDEHQNLNVMSMIARRQGAKVCAVIAGDWHHYNHYTAPDLGMHFIVAGGGGAFLHATHDLRAEVEFNWAVRRKQASAGGTVPGLIGQHPVSTSPAAEDEAEWMPKAFPIVLKETPRPKAKPAGETTSIVEEIAEEVEKEATAALHLILDKPRCYPDRWQSRWMSLRNLLFPIYNWKFAIGIGAIYWLVTWMFHIVVTDERVGGAKFDQIGAEGGLAGYLAHLSVVPGYIIEAMSYSIGFALTLAAMLGGLIWYVQVDETRGNFARWTTKIVVGGLHFLAHLTTMMALAVLFVRWHQYLSPNIQQWLSTFWDWFSRSAPILQDKLRAPGAAIQQGRGWVPHVLGFIYPIEMGLIGGLVGGFIWGLYWVIACVLARMHCGDAFAALRIKGYRNFLRMKFEPDKLTIYPIGMDRVPGKDGWRDPALGEPELPNRPRLVPVRPLPLKLLERPIVIRAKDVREV